MINATGNRMTLEIRRQAALSQQIARTQIQISTGKKIQAPSDDPIASARIGTIRRAQADDAAWTANLDLGLSLASQADTVMANTADNMTRVKELVLSAANATLSPADRQTIALELQSIADQVDAFAATRSSLGQPLFHASVAPAFRFSENLVFAPVPTADQTFAVNGTPLSQIIRDAASAVSAGNMPAINASLTTVENGIDHVADISAEIGVRASRMERLRESHLTRGIDLAAERSGLEDTDLTEAIAKLNAQTITLEAAQAAFARINRRTLIDILG
jgi:flagellar hook-associated protein 3 FlgL